MVWFCILTKLGGKCDIETNNWKPWCLNYFNGYTHPNGTWHHRWTLILHVRSSCIFHHGYLHTTVISHNISYCSRKVISSQRSNADDGNEQYVILGILVHWLHNQKHNCCHAMLGNTKIVDSEIVKRLPYLDLHIPLWAECLRLYSNFTSYLQQCSIRKYHYYSDLLWTLPDKQQCQSWLR